ncbi:MAG: FHA domain-containing protein [Enterobacterales bacterium]|nr:FHA domain-containing protein [Enterobacterales bacterium]
MLKIQFKDRRKPAMWLVDSSIRIGSDPKCDLQIDEASVDPVHCELLVDQDVITLTCLSKKRSVFVNEIPVVSSQTLKAWDIIRVGASDLEVIDPLSQDKRPAANSESNKTIIRPAVSDWMLKANTVPFVGQFFSYQFRFYYRT